MSLIAVKKGGADLLSDAAPQAQNALIEHPIISQLQEKNNIEAARFLSLLTDDEEFTFQTFDDKKERRDPKLITILHGTLDQHLAQLTRLNEAGAGIFFTVNETDLQGREAKNIKKARAVFIDLDGASLAPILKAPLEPHVIVATSSGRFHVYWVVDGLPLEEFTMVQKALIRRFNADPAVHDLSRVMRVPGFYHHKSNPILVRIFSNSGTQPYQADQFIKNFEIDLKEEALPSTPKLGLDHILMELNKRGLVRRPLPNHPGGWDILCPFADNRTTGDEGTAYFEAHTNGYKGSGFKMHAGTLLGKGHR